MYAETFEWIFLDAFESKQLHFRSWLEGQNDIYWITGKPGSGKSTLMKYISKHGITHESLRHWSGGKRLITASFFFWISGSSVLQRSQEGLLRSLLYEIFREVPGLLCRIMPNRYRNIAKTGIDILDKVSLLRSGLAQASKRSCPVFFLYTKCN